MVMGYRNEKVNLTNNCNICFNKNMLKISQKLHRNNKCIPATVWSGYMFMLSTLLCSSGYLNKTFAK